MLLSLSHLFLLQKPAVSGTCLADNRFPKASETRERGRGWITGPLSICTPQAPGSPRSSKRKGHINSSWSEALGPKGCAVSALTHLAFPAAVQGGLHGAPGCALPTRGTRRPYRGWGGAVRGSRVRSPGSVAGSGEAALTQGLREADRGNGHAMGPGHPRTLALRDSSGRFATVLSRPRVKGGFQGQGTPRGRGQRGEGGVPSGPGHGDPAATAREDKVAPSGAGI